MNSHRENFRFITAHSIQSFGELDWSDLIPAVYIEHKTLGLGKLLDIELRPGKSPLFSVRFPGNPIKRFNLSAIDSGFIVRVGIDRSKLGEDADEVIDGISRLGSDEDLIKEINSEIERILDSYSKVEYIAPQLSAQDFALVSNWSSRLTYRTAMTIHDLEKMIGKYESMRLCSARQAEKVVAAHYDSLGFQVEDISITQLSPGSSKWRMCDLKVGGTWVDVKNARRAFGNPDNYSEQFVKEFKTTPNDGLVRIVGTLADYQTINKYLLGEHASILVLGQVTIYELEKMRAWITEYDSDLVAVQHFTERHGFLPGWFFDFSDEFYSTRSTASQRIRRLLKKIKTEYAFEKVFSDSCCAPFARAAWLDLIPDRDCIESKRFMPLFAEAVEQLGFNRRSLFVSLMLYALLHFRSSTELKIDDLEKVIFPTHFNDRSDLVKVVPLGLYDPAKFIYSFIQLLKILCKNAKKELTALKSFRLSGPNILRGRQDNGRWITIISYCGGWNLYSNVKCGKNPLILGVNKICSDCGRLICDACGFCSKACQGKHRHSHIPV